MTVQQLDDLPGKIHAIQQELSAIECEHGSDTFFTIEAIQEACSAALKGNYGVGAVIVHEGAIIARGQNRIMEKDYQHAPAAHGESEAIFAVRTKINAHIPRNAMTLYAPLEPCMMCTSIIMNEGIGAVKIGSLDPPGGMIISHYDQMPPVFKEIIGGSGMKIGMADIPERVRALSWDIFFLTKHAIDARLKEKK